jgi:DNA-binding response OmpR family regulator
VLVVEDNDEMRAYLREILSERWAVQVAEKGEEAWDLIQAEAPDLVLSDVMMPETGGAELCERIKSAEAHRVTPVLLLTAKAGEEATVEGLESGADDFVTKPFGPEELRGRIENHLAAREHARACYRNEVSLSNLGEPVEEKYVPFLETVTEATEAHLSDPDFTTDQLAEEVALSRRQLTRRLKKAIGKTPAEFVRDCRIERAKTLLEEESRTVAEVAYAVGFRSPSHFSQAFQEEAGPSPSAYRDA